MSSTYDDLTEYRSAVRNAILRLGHQPIGMEDFGSRPDAPKKAALDTVNDCDAFIRIYAYRYGSIAEGDSLSIIEQEFDTARAAGRPIFGYLINPQFDWHGPRDEGEKAEHLSRFNAKVSTLLRSQYTTPDDLAWQVASDLGREFQKKIPLRSSGTLELAQFELAREMLRLVSHFREEYYRARSHIVLESEYASRPRGTNENTDEAYLGNQQYARLNRIRPMSDALHQLEQLIPEAEVILQPNIYEFIAPLDREMVRLFDSIYYYYALEIGRIRGDGMSQSELERQNQYLRTLRSPHPKAAYFGEDDEVGKRVDGHIDNLKAELKKYVR